MQEASSRKSTLRIATYNAALLPAPTLGLGKLCTFLNWPIFMDQETGTRRIQIMLATLAESGAEVVCLQEIWDTVAFRWSDVLRQEAARYGYTVHPDPIPCGYATNSGLAVLSKLRFLEADSHIFAASSGLQWFIPKGFQHITLLDAERHAVHVINTHIHASAIDTAICNSPHKSIRIQQRQIMQISEHIRKYLISNTPKEGSAYIPCLIMAGDFNVDARKAGPGLGMDSTVPFAWLASHMTLRFALHHMHTQSKDDFVVTYPYRSIPVSAIVDQEVYNYQSCLDHIFASRHFVDTPKLLHCYDIHAQCHVSDHCPVITTIQL